MTDVTMNPVLVNAWRGPIVESTHRGAIAICTPSETHLELGDIDRPIYPRSAVKLIQALAVVETGAASHYGFGDRALALCCASHSGEPDHVSLARSMLSAVGLTCDDLECGGHVPMGQEAAKNFLTSGKNITPLHNNCSGKHAGMLAVASRLGVATAGYVRPDHPVQCRVRETFEEVCQTDLQRAPMATDGCSVPTWAMSLRNMAKGFARLSAGDNLSSKRQEAARTLFSACARNPFYVAGTDRFCTNAMSTLGEAVYVKTGAEGVFCGALPARGIAIALKIDDGATRASEIAMAGILKSLLGADGARIAALAEKTLRNWRGLDVGALRLAEPLKEALKAI